MRKTAERLGFLWGAYKPQYWYWELIENSRRLLLTAVLSVWDSGSSKQNVVGVLLAFAFIIIYGYCQPYDVHSDFLIAEVGLCQIFLTYFAIIVMKQNLLGTSQYDSLLNALLIGVNVTVLVFAFYYVDADPDLAKLNTKVKKILYNALTCCGVWGNCGKANENNDEDDDLDDFHREESSDFEGSMHSYDHDTDEQRVSQQADGVELTRYRHIDTANSDNNLNDLNPNEPQDKQDNDETRDHEKEDDQKVIEHIRTLSTTYDDGHDDKNNFPELSVYLSNPVSYNEFTVSRETTEYPETFVFENNV
jgi:hypothetical protein